MMRFRSLLALVPLAVAITACLPADPLTGPGAAVRLHFEATPADHGKWMEEPEISVEGTDGGIIVEALMSAPNPCRRFDAKAAGAGDAIVLDVDVRPLGGGCYSIIGTFEYDAVLSGLAPGTHRLVIRHTMHATGDPSPRTVFDGSVIVR